jgi:creatinine amidohydrolase
MKTRFLPYMTWPEVEAIDKKNALVVLPIGATEQHGPHLPLYTDTLISSGVLKRAMDRLSEEKPVYMLSPITISKSNEHRGFAGTLWIGAKTLYDVLYEVGRSVHESGFSKLCFFNGHGGNLGILQAVTRDLRDDFGLLTFVGAAWSYLDAPPLPEGVDPREPELGIHANFFETAMVKAMHPDLVHDELAAPSFPDLPNTKIGLSGPAYAQWITKDWSKSGVFGDPTHVTNEIANDYLERSIQGTIQFINEMLEYEAPAS